MRTATQPTKQPPSQPVMGNGCGNLIKYIFGFANLLVFTGGPLPLGIGMMRMSALHGDDNAAFSEIISAEVYSVTVILSIVAGSFIEFMIVIVSCCGCDRQVAFRDNRWMLATYFCFVPIIFVLTTAAAVTGFVFGGDAIINTLRDNMSKSLKNYKNGSVEAVAAWDTVQQDFECCGINRPIDYGLLADDAPGSCYKDMNRNKVNKFFRGCFGQTLAFVSICQKNSSLLGGTALGVSLSLLMVVVSACFLRSIVKSGDAEA